MDTFSMDTFSIWHWLILLFVCILFVPLVMYILSFRKTASVINANGGKAPVNASWFLLIPIFSVVWYFIILMQMRSGLPNRALTKIDNQWWVFGMAAGATGVFSMLLSPVADTSIQLLLTVAQITLGIMHWVKLVQLRDSFSGS